MFKRPYVRAIVSFLMIPAVTVLAGMLINSIDPEIAARTSNYERNFWLLTQAKNLSMLAVLLMTMGLWFLTCFFLIKSKKRSYGWLPLAMLGPFGLIVLTLLSDNAPAPADLYHQFVGKLNIYLRVAYELCFFLVVWVGAFLTMVLKRDLMIMSKPPPPEFPQRKSSIGKTPPAVCMRSARVWKSCFWWFSSICCGRFVLT